ncbi:uncharacterized protein LOC106774708 [Vigna radiata var. radiata]|uniref:Uncharacterized protein LOC106774708 n=1 Tax=Vigna radiata var. radiata TaxID=3916 RepID=A0A1S3VFV1_VIGRR|nr:uncharacterized protein LOC106774708 [Vigna radiata var. radiata]
MAEENNGRRTLADYSTVVGPHHFNSIARPRVNAANMEMKSTLIQLVKSNQFNGLSHGSPFEHLTTFNEICNTVKIIGVPNEAIRLSLFPFSLEGNAKLWQGVEETLCQVWDRYKSLLRKTPTHGFDDATVVILFLGGLASQTKLLLDASAGGNIKCKILEEAHELIENMAIDDNEMHSERGTSPQQKGVLQLQSQDALLAQNKIITQ